jgi:hypothetical protein
LDGTEKSGCLIFSENQYFFWRGGDFGKGRFVGVFEGGLREFVVKMRGKLLVSLW